MSEPPLVVPISETIHLNLRQHQHSILWPFTAAAEPQQCEQTPRNFTWICCLITLAHFEFWKKNNPTVGCTSTSQSCKEHSRSGQNPEHAWGFPILPRQTWQEGTGCSHLWDQCAHQGADSPSPGNIPSFSLKALLQNDGSWREHAASARWGLLTWKSQAGRSLSPSQSLELCPAPNASPAQPPDPQVQLSSPLSPHWNLPHKLP